MALIGANTAEKIWNFLLEFIMNEHGVAALMGNLEAESGLKPTNLQDSTENRLNYADDTYTAAVDSGKYTNFVHDSAGYGLAQWTYWSRKQGLLDYVRSAGKSIGDLECQLVYLAKELSTNYKSVLNTLKTATSVKAASDVVLKDFEKPKIQTEKVKTERAANGQKYYDLYSKGKVNSMSVRVGSARSNENGGINGGAAGDQTGREVATQAWYLHSKGWVVLRAKDAAVREKIAHNMESICANDNIGYCQDHRATLTSAAKPYGYDASKVTQKVEVDCSEAVRNCLLYAGITIASFSTATEASALAATGVFEKLTDSKYCNSSDYLLRGDILVTKTKGHTVVVLDNGAKAGASSTSTNTNTSASTSSSSGSLNKTEKWKGKTTTSLKVRSWAGKENGECSFSPLASGEEISVCDETTAKDGSKWYYIKNKAGKYGFASAEFIVPVDSGASASYAIGDKVKVTGTIYGTGTGSGGSLKKTNSTMYVVDLVSSSTYKYYIGLAASKGGKRQGWAEPSILTKSS